MSETDAIRPAPPSQHDRGTEVAVDLLQFSGGDMAMHSTLDPDDLPGQEHENMPKGHYGTGEHITAGREPDIRIGGDIAPDRIVGPEEAGLGGGLDEAEEALAEITDDEAITQRPR